MALSRLLAPAESEQKIKGTPENFQQAFKISSSCNKALCAVQKIFGPEVGPQMLYLMDQFDINTSPYAFINASTFTAAEIADVIRTLELVHPDQLPFGSNKKLIHFKRGYTRASYGDDGGNVVANATIELFDSWTEQSSIMRQYSLYHEIAHNHSDNQFSDYDRSTIWLDISDWKETKKGDFDSLRKKAKQGHPFVSRYGETNPFEDFAESLTAYRFNPSWLKQKSKDKYNLIKLLVHDGLEYTSTRDCQRTPISRSYQKSIEQNGDRLSQADKDYILKSCRKPFYESVLGHLPTSFFDSCVNYEATLLWQKQNQQQYPDLVEQALFDPNLRSSTLKFKKVRVEIAEKLQPEMTDWILKSMEGYTYQMNSSQSNAEYCEVWAKMENSIYPELYLNNNWARKSVFSSRNFRPSGGAARGLCLDLVQGFVPTAKSTRSTVTSWLRKSAYLPDDGKINERGITRESLMTYIKDRTRLYEK
ncbi:hypothetical protein EZJ49_06870 [Bdellovibrio bacteriovorus]|uniref:hypothetical protein n=1 Tax=Bdellovibrio bacteriovorus TaxID=959 RepID=UPI0021D30247|nr:hypothetical protein [Bdellovibrio bacteriovorus]UXR65968.1 hypothetical protein EZJ49_06870 [Bdellovibrio bacteriovorus]